MDAAATETQQSADTVNAEGIKKRVVSHLQRLEAARGRAMMRGTGLLATIGCHSTVRRIVRYRLGHYEQLHRHIETAYDKLAIVAPGIAEALFATAMGLVVAIPAVVIYNAFSRAIAAYRALSADAAAAVLRLTSRDLDRAAASSALTNQGTAASRLRVQS